MENLFRIESSQDTSDRTATEQLVDQELAKFDLWFQEQLGTSHLIKSEKAILKTYLYYKLYGESK